MIMAYDVTYLFPVCVKFIVEEAKVMTPIYLFSRSFFSDVDFLVDFKFWT